MYVTSSFQQYIYIPYSIFYDQEIKSRFWGQNKPEYTKIRRKQLEQGQVKKKTPGKKKEEREREKGVDQRKPKGLMITAMEME